MNLECSVNGWASIPWNPTEHEMDTSREEEEGVYFAKYLTNQNLLQLQLSDSNFRRYFLLQCLILFQYLKSNVKFKTDTQVLSDDQVSTLMQCFSLELPPFLAFAFLSKRPSSIHVFATKSIDWISSFSWMWISLDRFPSTPSDVKKVNRIKLA